MKIAFTHNLRLTDSEEEAEFDTADTVGAIADALTAAGHDVEKIEVSGPASHLAARIEAYAPDLIFNTAEGRRGRAREALLPGGHGGVRRGPVGIADQHDHLARHLIGQLARGQRQLGRLLVLRQEREDVGVQPARAPETPLVHGHRQNHQQPQDRHCRPQARAAARRRRRRRDHGGHGLTQSAPPRPA